MGLLKRLELDRAVAYNVLNIATRVAVAPLTALLIGLRFSPDERGLYFTFYSLVTMQVLVELGLNNVLIQFASHEASRLKVGPRGQLSGDELALARFHGLGRYGVRWYTGSALVVAGLLTPGGIAFFRHSPPTDVAWLGPWLALCGAACLRLWFTPFWALLEGCNEVVSVYRFRLLEGVWMALAQWSLILAGAGLWVPAASVATSVVWSLAYLVGAYPRLLAFLARPGREAALEARELYPMQARMAVSWVSSFLTYQLFTPVTFHYWGAALAGQVGMAWLLAVNGIGPVAQAWVNSRAPRFGMLVARRQWTELDASFGRVYRVALGVASLLTLALGLAVLALYQLGLKLADSILPPGPTAIFLLGAWMLQLANPLATYLRAHKQEPLAQLSLAYALVLSLSTWQLGGRFGPTAMGCGFVACNLFYVAGVARIWARCRRLWHTQRETQADDPVEPPLPAPL